MDKEVLKGLSEKFYDRRKSAAELLENQVKTLVAQGDTERIKLIIDQLCSDYAYAVHHPNARNGGLIGLAATAIGLGQNELPLYLEDIVHPVLACFGDQDVRVRYYACESMYNIAKVAKGEILLYFNEIFDALCKLASDTNSSLRTGTDMLDRLIKDIVAEKASTHISVIHKANPASKEMYPLIEQTDANGNIDKKKPVLANEPTQSTLSFSLPKFIPLLMERIYAINPATRIFLVQWITLLDSVPDLELVTYLPSFLGGLITFLADPSNEVVVATSSCLNRFLNDIRHISEIKALRPRIESDESVVLDHHKLSDSSLNSRSLQVSTPSGKHRRSKSALLMESSGDPSKLTSAATSAISDYMDNNLVPASPQSFQSGRYIPGQDVFIDFDKIIEILLSHLDSSTEKIQLTVLGWIETLMDLSLNSLLPFVPRFLSELLPAMAYEGEELRHSAENVNKKLQDLIVSLPEDNHFLDYPAVVNSLTLHFLSEQEQTREAAFEWLILLHKKTPQKTLAINDGTFPALLKTLSDPSEIVVTKDLELLAQICYNADDEHFAIFMNNLLNLFSTDRRLLETRGNLIVRQLCTSLNPERIYRTLSEILEKDEDIEFSSIMVQNLNNNLIAAPELADLRSSLRSFDSHSGSLFVSLFRSWCHNSIAALSLCLLAQTYEHAYLVLQIMVDFEISVSLLVQIDRLVQLLESPVFSYLRLQLLEPDRYPYLYKCLYGILMVLPQSTAFNTLKNRLNAVSAIGFAHVPTRKAAGSDKTSSTASLPRVRIDDSKWQELLERFRTVQRRHHDSHQSVISRHRRKESLVTSKGPAALGYGEESPTRQLLSASRVKTQGSLQQPAASASPQAGKSKGRTAFNFSKR